MLILKVLGLWFLILGLAVANGGLRETLLFEVLPRSAAFTMSGLLLIVCVLGVATLFVPWLGMLSVSDYALIGLFWLALTLVFEFSFGLLIRGESWSAVLEAYKFKGGNIWPLVLISVAVAPWVGARIRHLV